MDVGGAFGVAQLENVGPPLDVPELAEPSSQRPRAQVIVGRAPEITPILGTFAGCARAASDAANNRRTTTKMNLVTIENSDEMPGS